MCYDIAGGDEVARLQQELLQEKAQTVQLDLQVRSLCAELHRAQRDAGTMAA